MIPLRNRLPAHVGNGNNVYGFKEAFDAYWARPRTVSFRREHKTHLLDLMLHLIPCLSETQEHTQSLQPRRPAKNRPIWTIEWLKAKLSSGARRTERKYGKKRKIYLDTGSLGRTYTTSV